MQYHAEVFVNLYSYGIVAVHYISKYTPSIFKKIKRHPLVKWIAQGIGIYEKKID